MLSKKDFWGSPGNFDFKMSVESASPIQKVDSGVRLLRVSRMPRTFRPYRSCWPTAIRSPQTIGSSAGQRPSDRKAAKVVQMFPPPAGRGANEAAPLAYNL